MKSVTRKLLRAGLTALVAGLCALAQAGDAPQSPAPASADKPDAGNLRAFIELARSDIRTRKALLVAENLPLTGDEAAEFWPLHREYETESSRLNDEKLALIERYANNYQRMTDQEALALAQASFTLEEKRTALKRKYLKKFTKVIPATKAVRFFQVENQLNMVLDLRVAAALPLIK